MLCDALVNPACGISGKVSRDSPRYRQSAREYQHLARERGVRIAVGGDLTA